jgi:radical SAM protein with 4Fe4S-binding SPASM domain
VKSIILNRKSEHKNDIEQVDIGWVDEFVEKIKPYIFVREIDNLLILIPNQAYTLNPSGVAMLLFLLKGHSILEFLYSVGDSPRKREDLHFFFCDLRAAVSGCLREYDSRKAVAYYEYSGQVGEYPVLSEVAVTYRCNLACRFCYVGDKQCQEMTTKELKKVLLGIRREAQVPSVSFTGGEPLLRDDLCDLVAYATGIGMWTNLITNGTLLRRERIAALRDAGLKSAQVSIEGHTAEVHDRLTGVAGSFRATVAGIRMLQNAGIRVHTNTTISRENVAYAEKILPFAQKIGLERVSMNLLIPCGAAARRRDLWVSYSEIGEYIMRMKRRARDSGIDFLWYSPVPLCTFNPIAHGFGNKSCAAMTGLLSVDPQGNIIPCSSWPMPIGSLLRQRFQDIWQTPMLSYFRNIEYAPDACRRCTHLDVCKGACPLYWHACGEGELDARA